VSNGIKNETDLNGCQSTVNISIFGSNILCWNLPFSEHHTSK